MLRALTVACLSLVASASAHAATVHHLRSPNGRLEVAVEPGARFSYDVLFDGKPLVRGATLALDVDHVKLGPAATVAHTRWSQVDRRLEPAVRQKAAVIPERYNELRLECEGGFAVVFRAYDQGAAYRFETSLPRDRVTVYGEEAAFTFAADADAYYPKEDSFFSHNERIFQRLRLSAIAPADLASIPAVVETPVGPKVAITDADVDDYPGLWFRGTSAAGLTAVFPPVAVKEKRLKDRDIKVEKAADYIAVTRGTRTYPWRVLGVAEKDTDLVASTLTWLLARPSELADTSWIKPGKVAWDWWNALGLKGVDFKPGVNTQTYKYFIDFAASAGIEYIILDEGWSKPNTLLQPVPAIDMPALLAHARSKNVGIILWAVWKTFDNEFAPALALFEKWGVKGVKVDFMQRDDQAVINFYHRVSRELGKRKMLVDYHGAIRPALMTRTWPNLVNTEGVQGLEHVKWSNATTPEHDVTLPFTRMFIGPLDYTPGAMLNASQAAFKINFKDPMSMGTRCHQLAMYAIYEAPLQMLCDSPTSYQKEPDAMEFLGPVPTVWDETRVLDGKLGDYVVVARRKGREWWVGAMTDWTPRALKVELSFLGAGKFQMTAYADGPDAEKNGSDYRKTTTPVDATTRLEVKLAPGGGWAARIKP